MHLSLVLLPILFILSSCHGGDLGHDIGALCDDNSPCRDPYICEYGRCRSECKLDIDCDDGTCVQSAIDRDAYVCTLVIESSCKNNGCPKGLYCADDDVCRSGCDDSEDCLKDQLCRQHVCYSNAKIDNDSGSTGDPDNEHGSNGTSLNDANAGETDSDRGAGGSGGIVDESTDELSGGNSGELDSGTSAGSTGGEITNDTSEETYRYGVSGQSCNDMTGTECNGESCCTSITVPGGTFEMGRGSETCSNCTDGCPGETTCYPRETPEHDVTVSDFSLDKYEVTVGRFRKFVEAYDKLGTPPPEGSGAHPEITGTGWQKSWNVNLPVDASALQKSLACDSNGLTWGTENDLLPINCISWYEAFAFCIWDGGRLPTESEWEYVATGGNENRIYPWNSNEAPSCRLANGAGCSSGPVTVGSFVSGKGRWGHMDLAGNVWEYVFDWYSDTWYLNDSAVITDSANIAPSSHRVQRGGSFGGPNEDLSYLRVVFRTYSIPTGRYIYYGVRCARSAF